MIEFKKKQDGSGFYVFSDRLPDIPIGLIRFDSEIGEWALASNIAMPYSYLSQIVSFIDTLNKRDTD